MSTIKCNNAQIGQSVTATNNFVLYQPASPDGTVRLGNGNSGSVTDLVTVGSTGNLTFTGTTETYTNSVTISAASTKTLTLNGGAGSNGLVIDASNNIGIGGSPSYKLTLVDQANNGFGFYENNDGEGAIFRGYRSRGNTSAPTAVQSNDVLMGVRGFGYTSAGAYGPRAAALNFYAAENFTSAAQGTYITFETTSIGSTSTIERARIDASGNLGLGVTPSAWTDKAIQVYNGGFAGTSAGYYTASNAYNSSGFKYISNGYATYFDGNVAGTGKQAWYNATSGTAGNAITFNQAMTLDASGNLLVGKTSTSNYGDGSQIYPAGTISLGHPSGTGSGAAYALFGYAGGGIGSITQSGTTAVLYNVTSDQRLKENIVDAPNALSSINAIKVRSFDWKADGSHSEYGYIAQELLEVAPEAVHVPTDPDEMMGVDFGKLTPRLVKAIQELSAEIETLKQRIK